jgi:DNA polymerase-3 subunit beta
MKLEVLQEKLIKALNIVSRVASSKTGLPILNNILFRTDGTSLVLSATNLEVAVVNYIGAKVIKPGTITIPAKLLTEFVSNLPKETISLKVEKNHLIIESGSYRSVINGIDSDDFPELPIIDEKKAIILKTTSENIKESFSQTIISASNDTSRPVLTGVYFNTFNGNLYLAATDGYRLSEKLFLENIKDEISIVVPVVSLQEVVRSLTDENEEIEILLDENQIKFRLNEIEITSKTIGGSFPNYRRLIPEKTEINLKINTDELKRVAKLAGLFARESGDSIIIESIKNDGVLSIRSVASELGENNSNIKTKVSADSKITLNSKFLIDAIGCMSEDEIVFGFSGKMSPVILKNINRNDYIHIIMPLKS